MEVVCPALPYDFVIVTSGRRLQEATCSHVDLNNVTASHLTLNCSSVSRPKSVVAWILDRRAAAFSRAAHDCRVTSDALYHCEYPAKVNVRELRYALKVVCRNTYVGTRGIVTKNDTICVTIQPRGEVTFYPNRLPGRVR